MKSCALKKSKLTLEAQRKLLKTPGARKATVLAGDQAAEGFFGTTKNTMTRFNLKGRACGKKGHVNFLSSAWLLREPGLDAVLKALRLHRLAVQDTVPPRLAYEDDSWLGDVATR